MRRRVIDYGAPGGRFMSAINSSSACISSRMVGGTARASGGASGIETEASSMAGRLKRSCSIKGKPLAFALRSISAWASAVSCCQAWLSLVDSDRWEVVDAMAGTERIMPNEEDKG